MTTLRNQTSEPERDGSLRDLPRCLSTLIPLVLLIWPVQAIGQETRPRATQFGGSRGGVTIDYDGFTIPKYDVLVAATEIGRLEEIRVRVGQRVKTGQTIAKLEDGLQREAVATAQWRAQMHGETDAAQAETALARLRVDQLEKLAKQKISRPDELKRAIADWEVAKARELSAREQDRLRQLELERYQLQLRRRNVLAPMDGVVADVFRAPGEYITPSEPAVVRLLVLDQLYGVFNVPVEEIKAVAVGETVSVFLTSAGKSVNGVVDSIAPDIDGESGTIKVKVLIDNPDGLFRSGDRCQMKPSRTRAATNPSNSTGTRRIGQQLYRLNASGAREIR